MAEYPLRALIGSQTELDAIPSAVGNLKINAKTGAAFFELNAQGDKVNLVGTAPQRGVDYWTAADIANIKGYIDEQLGVIANGSY